MYAPIIGKMITSWIWFIIPNEFEDEDELEEKNVVIRLAPTPKNAAKTETVAKVLTVLGTSAPIHEVKSVFGP